MQATPTIRVEKPRLGIPASLIVDDPTPCINPLYYFRLQVDRANYAHHESCIPLNFLEDFIHVCQARGIRGKFSVLPYPAGLGSILEGWEGCDRRELTAWIELVRTAIAPHFDITPEILTHTLALDLRTHRLLQQSEHEWLAERSRDEMTAYFSAALDMLKAAGFSPTGITQPCYFNGSRDDYNHAVLESIRNAGGPAVTFYFIDGYFDDSPFPPPEVVLLDRERGEAVVSIIDYCHDYFWPTQRPSSHSAEQVADQFITADGASGRLVELAEHDAWLVFVCHWQSIYSDGSRQGLATLDQVVARLAHIYGAKLTWLTLSEIARYRAASEGCTIDVHQHAEGWTIELDAAIDCPDFTLSLQGAQLAGARVAEVTRQAEDQPAQRLHPDLAERSSLLRVAVGTADQPAQRLHPDLAGDALLPSNAWRQEDDRLMLCFDLCRGHQSLSVRQAKA